MTICDKLFILLIFRASLTNSSESPGRERKLEGKTTTMSLDSYIDEDDSQQKQTHVTFPNPDHPDTSGSHASEEDMRQHFRAANAIQDSRINRKAIVGDFLVALDEEVHEGDGEALEEFIDELTS